MAEFLQVGKHWFHSGKNAHYDIPKRRIEEITSKCTVISSRELYLITLENTNTENDSEIKGIH
jgi:hypothetical protein